MNRPTGDRRRENDFDKKILSELLNDRRTIDETTGCWLYNWKLHRTGYAYIRIFNKLVPVHRISMWIYKNIDMNSNWKIDKILHVKSCFNKHCFNPDHLYIGTQRDNVNDSMELGTHSCLNH